MPFTPGGCPHPSVPYMGGGLGCGRGCWGLPGRSFALLKDDMENWWVSPRPYPTMGTGSESGKTCEGVTSMAGVFVPNGVCQLVVVARGLGRSVEGGWGMTVSGSSASVGITMALLRPLEVMKMGRRLPVCGCTCRAYPPPHPTVGTGPVSGTG